MPPTPMATAPIVNISASSAPVKATEEGPVEGPVEEPRVTGLNGKGPPPLVGNVVGVTVVGWVHGP